MRIDASCMAASFSSANRLSSCGSSNRAMSVYQSFSSRIISCFCSSVSSPSGSSTRPLTEAAKPSSCCCSASCCCCCCVWPFSDTGGTSGSCPLPQAVSTGSSIHAASSTAKNFPFMAYSSPDATVRHLRGGCRTVLVVIYLAYSTTLVSRSTWTLIWPGYSSSFSMRLANSLARITISSSLTCSGFTITRTSRPA